MNPTLNLTGEKWVITTPILGLYDHIRRYFVRRILNFSAPRSRLICVNSYAIKFKTSVLLPLILNQLLNKSCRCQLSCLEILFLTIKRVRKLISLYFQVKVQKFAKHCQLEVVGSTHQITHTVLNSPLIYIYLSSKRRFWLIKPYYPDGLDIYSDVVLYN